MAIADILLLALLVIIIIYLLKRQKPLSKEELLQFLERNQEKSQLESKNEVLEKQNQYFLKLQTNLIQSQESMMKTIMDNLNKSQESVSKQLQGSQMVFGEVQKKLGFLEKSSKNMEDIGRNISSLQQLLSVPKLRGSLGEYLLEDLLKQIFPAKNFEMQYKFKSGTGNSMTVDAVIKLADNLVPIDSKFPLESFERLIVAGEKGDEDFAKAAKKEFIISMKNRIDEVAKYILPEQGTFEFAMMYIPAENVFYETIINDGLTAKEYEIFNYALSRRVIPVSPNSLYAYLMAIVFGLKGLKVEQEAKKIVGELSDIQDKFAKFYSEYNKVSQYLNNATKSLDNTNKKANTLNISLSKVTDSRPELEQWIYTCR